MYFMYVVFCLFGIRKFKGKFLCSNDWKIAFLFITLDYFSEEPNTMVTEKVAELVSSAKVETPSNNSNLPSKFTSLSLYQLNYALTVVCFRVSLIMFFRYKVQACLLSKMPENTGLCSKKCKMCYV